MPDPSISPTQAAIVQKLVEGRYPKEAAYELGITESAAKVQLFRARQKVSAGTLYELVAIAVARGWCTPQSGSQPLPPKRLETPS
jgi:DNA-binding CsgD family transcriptional regulator